LKKSYTGKQGKGEENKVNKYDANKKKHKEKNEGKVTLCKSVKTLLGDNGGVTNTKGKTYLNTQGGGAERGGQQREPDEELEKGGGGQEKKSQAKNLSVE